MIELNNAGESHARELIQAGKIDRGPWSFDAADGNALLGPKGSHWTEYSRFHLAVDTDADEDTKARWKYPFGKDGKVFIRALSAIRSRASQEGATEVYDAAGKLLDEAKDKEGDEAKDKDKDRPEEKSADPRGVERRCYLRGIELRAAAEGQGPGTVVGYAAVYDRWSEDLGGFVERIRPGAFDGCMSQDVRALANHDPSQLLGRTTSGTLRMRPDAVGLRVEVDLPDTHHGRDIATSIRRGDMDGMSFSFTLPPGGSEWNFESSPATRTISRVKDLYDVGPVTYPAYPDTSAAMRSLDRARARAEPDRRRLSQARGRQRLAEASLSDCP